MRHRVRQWWGQAGYPGVAGRAMQCGLMLVVFGSVGWAAAADRLAAERELAIVLPDAPGRVDGALAVQDGSVSGTVLDINGAPVPGAQVTLSHSAGGREVVVQSDGDGKFSFDRLKSERFRVTITATGLETFVSNEIHLGAGEKYALPNISLPLAPTNATVNVTVTEDQLATEQVKEEEKQRVFGVLPNFYTSYLWNAAPMRTKQKFRLVLRSSIDPFVFVVVGIRAGEQQYKGTYKGFGDDAQGFFSRYGVDYGDAVTGRLIGSAILPSLLHQDPRYFYHGSGSVKERAWYAIRQTFVCRGDNGKLQPNYSHVAGNFAAATITNFYLEPIDRHTGATLQRGASITGFNALSNLIREFLPRRAVTNVASYKSGKPVVEKE